MIKKKDLKEGMELVLPVRNLDTYGRYVKYGTEHFVVNVRMPISGDVEAVRFEVVGVVENGVRLRVKGDAPCGAVPEEEDYYVFVHSEVLDEVLKAAVAYKGHGSVETKPHEEREGYEGLKDCVRFKGITDRMYDTFKKKNADYGNSFRELYEECGLTYAYGHMREKLERVRSLMKNGAQVKGESMKDSLYDLANYAVLTIMEMERNEGVETPSHKEE